MATLNRSLQPQAAGRSQARPEGGVRFDLSVALLSLWFIIGLFVDGYAHNHGAVDDTFFTPYHALLYSGIFAVGLFLAISQYRNVGKGHAFTRALPYGYNLSLVGVVLFFVGGGFDFVWHSLFGFEANISTLLSPAHLLLATSGFLILTGPLRAAWRRSNDAPTWTNRLPVVLVLLMIVSLLTFFTQFANGFSHAWNFARSTPGSGSWQMDIVGISAVLIPAAITMGVLLFALRRWRLPTGGVTLILTANAAGMMFIDWGDMQYLWYLIVAALLAGIMGDVLLRILTPSPTNPFAFRVFAFGVPFALNLIYFVLLITQVGIRWEIHKWLGITCFAGAVGVFLSYLAMPPALPDEG